MLQRMLSVSKLMQESIYMYIEYEKKLNRISNETLYSEIVYCLL